MQQVVNCSGEPVGKKNHNIYGQVMWQAPFHIVEAFRVLSPFELLQCSCLLVPS